MEEWKFLDGLPRGSDVAKESKGRKRHLLSSPPSDDMKLLWNECMFWTRSEWRTSLCLRVCDNDRCKTLWSMKLPN